MRRLGTFLALLTFVGGLVVWPALHRIRGCDGHHTHRADCPVCQLALLPMEDAPAFAACPPQPPPSFIPAAPPLAPEFPVPDCGTARPRAPPVCG